MDGILVTALDEYDKEQIFVNLNEPTSKEKLRLRLAKKKKKKRECEQKEIKKEGKKLGGNFLRQGHFI